jgi:putative SOS response-associated peptidase YedK
MASWAEVVAFLQPLTIGGAATNDVPVPLRVMDNIPMIVFDRAQQKRRVVPMRWGFPHRHNPNRPDPIHARAESIDEKPTFRDAFLDGQRGIVLARTFNEGLDLPNGKTEQHTITPGDLAAVGMAFLWRRFEFPGQPAPVLCCVMATVPANALIAPITDRMPAVLALDDWATWLGENDAPPEAAKACLKTVEGVRWTMAKEAKASKPSRREKTPDLF